MDTNLQVLDNLIQGTEAWHDARRGVLTASVIGQLITPKTLKPANNDTARGLIASLVGERIAGFTESTFTNDDMMRGIEEEPFARDLYIEHFAPVEEVGFMIREQDGIKLGYSPDGVVGDDGLIEVKSRRQKKHVLTVVSGAAPVENMAQIQTGFWVSGRSWCDYISYCGGMKIWVQRVERDPRWQEIITEVARDFEKQAAEMIEKFTAATEGMPLAERTYDVGIVI